MKGGVTIAISVEFQVNSHDPALLRRIGRAVERCVQQSVVMQNLLQCGAASAHEDLFPHDFTVEVGFDERDIYQEDDDHEV